MFFQFKLPHVLSSLKRHNLCITVVFLVLIIHEFRRFSVVCCWAACFTFITIGRLRRNPALLFIILVKSDEIPFRLSLFTSKGRCFFVFFSFSRWEHSNQCHKLTHWYQCILWKAFSISCSREAQRSLQGGSIPRWFQHCYCISWSVKLICFTSYHIELKVQH